MKNFRKYGIGLMDLAILGMAAVTLVMMWGADSRDIAFNLIFLGIMTVLVHAANKQGIRKMESIAEDSRNIADKIAAFAEKKSGMELWKQVQHDPALTFQDPVIDSAWIEYCKKSIPGAPEEAVAEELVFERGNKGFCDLIPGLLTALGILGTFIGLIISMKSFSFDDPDTMGQALESIVGGINVAFYTSVYGVCLSILYNLTYRSKIQYITDSVYRLQETIRQKLSGFKEDDHSEQYLQYLAEENDVLRRIETALREELAGNLGREFADTLNPVFEQINQSLKRVIGDFREEQSASMKHIVTSFVEQMRDALDSHIDELGASVDRLSISQSEMTKEIKALLLEIENTAADTKKINQESGMILTKLEEYMDKIHAMISMTQQTYQTVERYTSDIHRTVQEQGRVISGLEAHEKKLVETCETIKNIEDGFASHINSELKLAEYMKEKQDAFVENQEHALRALGDYGQNMFQVITELKQVQLSASAETGKFRSALEETQKLQNQKWEELYALLQAAGTKKPVEKPDGGNGDEETQKQINEMLYHYLERAEKRESRRLTYRLRRGIAKLLKR